MQLGTFYGIGIGPGDPELITLKGAQILQQVPVIAFPKGIQGRPGMAEQIILPWLEGKQRLSLHFPYVLNQTVLTQAWQVAADQVWQHLSQGDDVAFACEGDASFYGTFTYVAQTLQLSHPEVKIQTVPGVCSPLAAAATLGIPLTTQSQRLLVLPALYHAEDLENALTQADVLVLMKVSSVYSQVWAILQKHNLLKHSYVVQRATFPDQVVYADLSDRPTLELPYFSLLIVQKSPFSIL